MIARCEWCEETTGRVVGYRVTGKLERWRCPHCGGYLRPGGKGIVVSIVAGHLLVPAEVKDTREDNPA